jgi:hypothetical protein
MNPLSRRSLLGAAGAAALSKIIPWSKPKDIVLASEVPPGVAEATFDQINRVVEPSKYGWRDVPQKQPTVTVNGGDVTLGPGHYDCVEVKAGTLRIGKGAEIGTLRLLGGSVLHADLWPAAVEIENLDIRGGTVGSSTKPLRF